MQPKKLESFQHQRRKKPLHFFKDCIKISNFFKQGNAPHHEDARNGSSESGSGRYLRSKCPELPIYQENKQGRNATKQQSTAAGETTRHEETERRKDHAPWERNHPARFRRRKSLFRPDHGPRNHKSKRPSGSPLLLFPALRCLLPYPWPPPEPAHPL